MLSGVLFWIYAEKVSAKIIIKKKQHNCTVSPIIDLNMLFLQLSVGRQRRKEGRKVIAI